MGDHREELKVLAILQSAVESTNEAFVTIDKDHKVLFFNKAAERVFGHSRDDVVGHDLNAIMAPRCSRDHRKAVERYVETRVPRRIGHQTEMVATRKNGETFPAEISFSVSEVGGTLYFTGIVRDLTETKALKEKIEKSERLAALGRLVAEIIHEIKNPLMMIGGFVRQLIRVTKEEKSLTKLNVIVGEVQRLENLLKELGEYYLPKALKRKKIEIHNLIQEVFLLVKEECEKKEIKADFDADTGPVTVMGDRGKLKQVLLNLFKNSIEAMDKGGALSVQSRLTGERVVISIADDGCGIPEKNLEKIFSPFFTTKRHGTGLGLSISKSIIEAHEDCNFDVKSREGKGTCFEIIMPLQRPKVKKTGEEKEL